MRMKLQTHWSISIPLCVSMAEAIAYFRQHLTSLETAVDILIVGELILFVFHFVAWVRERSTAEHFMPSIYVGGIPKQSSRPVGLLISAFVLLLGAIGLITLTPKITQALELMDLARFRAVRVFIGQAASFAFFSFGFFSSLDWLRTRSN